MQNIVAHYALTLGAPIKPYEISYGADRNIGDIPYQGDE
jgi:hypothetical protein